METTAKIIETMKSAGKPLKAGEIADLAGIDKKEVDKAIKKLKTDDLIHSPKRCFYEAR